MNKKLNDATKHIKNQDKSLDFGGRAIINAKLINCDIEGGGGGSAKDAVKYTEQSLTDSQKAQARTNIGAGSATDVNANAAAIAAETARAVAAEGALQQMISDVDRGEYVTAWDGTDAPVVADIPAGVTVTYGGTSYTGTLAASAGTVGKIYLVSDGNGEYDRYVTSQSGSTYSWAPLGPTDIPLSDYATEEELSQLDQKVGELYTSASQAEYALRKPTDSGTTTDDSNGKRLRVIFPVVNGAEFELSTTMASGIAVSLYNNLTAAIKADASYIETYTSYGYRITANGVTSSAGYLSVSLTNGNTAITDAKKAEMLASLSVFIKNGTIGHLASVEKETNTLQIGKGAISYAFPVVVSGTNTIIIERSFAPGVYGFTINPKTTGNTGGYTLSFTPSGNVMGLTTSCKIGLERIVKFTGNVTKIQISDIGSAITASGDMELIIRSLESTDATFSRLENVELNFSERLYGLFINGTISNGAYSNYQSRYRVASLDIHSYNRDITITAKTGYKFFVNLFDNSGTYESATSWLTIYTIPANKKFKISISTTNDNVDLDADTALNNVLVSTLLDTEIAGLRGEDWVAKLTTGTVTYSDGAWTISAYKASSRVCTNPDTPIHLAKDSIIYAPVGYMIYILWRTTGGVYAETGDWIAGKFVCPADGDYIFNYAKNPETDFTEATIAERVAGLSILGAENLSANEYVSRVQDNASYGIGKKTNIISVARCGYRPTSASTPPEHSIASYKEAYKHGYRYMLADVRWTSDNIPVCLHDASINAVARNQDGTTIGTTINIADITADEADGYDFGIIKGADYAGMGIPRVADFVKWCKVMNCIPILEIKVVIGAINDAKMTSLVDIIRQYGMSRSVIFEADAGQSTALKLHEVFPFAMIGKTCTKDTNFGGDFLTETLALKGEHNRVFWALYLATEMTGAVSDDMISYAYENDIAIYLTEVASYSDYLSFITDENNFACEFVAITGQPFDYYMNAGL